MALSNKEKEWILDQIRTTINGHGLRRFMVWVKSWSPLGAAVAVLLVFFNIWNNYVEFRTHTEDRLKSIEASLLALQVSQVSHNASDKKSQAEAKQLLESARSNSISLPKPVVVDAGESFIRAAKTDPDAWQAALQFISYSSFQNASLAASQNQLTGTTHLKTKYATETPQGFPLPRLSAYGIVPIAEAAILEHIGENTNPGPDGNQFLLIDGGALLLDHMHLKNVVLRGAHVVYHGGPLILESVYFLNCTFDIDPQSNGILFATNLLKSGPALTFSVV